MNKPLKKCVTCENDLSLDYFNKGQKICKTCHSQYYLKYKNNPEFMMRNQVHAKNNSKRLKIRNMAFINRYLTMFGKCIDCGEKNIRVLEFDHINGVKKKGIKLAASHTWSIDNIKKEIRKCEIRCCNCHRIKTQIQFNWGDGWETNWLGLDKYQNNN